MQLTKKALVWIFALIPCFAEAQNSLKLTLKDSISNDPLIGATVNISEINKATNTDVKGAAIFSNIISGTFNIRVSYVGYKLSNYQVTVKQNLDTVLLVAPKGAELDEVIVTSTRTNARIEDLPVKVEVLGKEEMDEENQIKPSNVGSILGDISIIHI